MTGVGSEEGTVKFDPIDQNNCSSKRVQNSGIRSIGDLSEVAIRSFAKKDEDVLRYIFPAAFDKYASLVQRLTRSHSMMMAPYLQVIFPYVATVPRTL